MILKQCDSLLQPFEELIYTKKSAQKTTQKTQNSARTLYHFILGAGLPVMMAINVDG